MRIRNDSKNYDKNEGVFQKKHLIIKKSSSLQRILFLRSVFYYSEQDCAVNGLTSSTNNHPQTNSGHRSQSVGFNGNRTRSNTQTPERDLRASSQARR